MARWQDTCDLGIQRAAVAGFFNAEETADPGDHFVAGRIGRLVKVDDTITDVLLQWTP